MDHIPGRHRYVLVEVHQSTSTAFVGQQKWTNHHRIGKTVSTQTPASNGINQRAVFTSIYFQQVTGLGRSAWHALSYDLVRNMNCRFQRMGDTGVMFGSMLVWLKTCTC